MKKSSARCLSLRRRYDQAPNFSEVISAYIIGLRIADCCDDLDDEIDDDDDLDENNDDRRLGNDSYCANHSGVKLALLRYSSPDSTNDNANINRKNHRTNDSTKRLLHNRLGCLHHCRLSRCQQTMTRDSNRSEQHQTKIDGKATCSAQISNTGLLLSLPPSANSPCGDDRPEHRIGSGRTTAQISQY